MLQVSFAWTSPAFADRTKTETRRFWKDTHASKFTPGREFMGRDKDPRVKTSKPLHLARVVFCRRERLGDMTEESYQREGGTRFWPSLAAYVEAMGGPDLVPYVLRFTHLPDSIGVFHPGLKVGAPINGREIYISNELP